MKSDEYQRIKYENETRRDIDKAYKAREREAVYNTMANKERRAMMRSEGRGGCFFCIMLLSGATLVSGLAYAMGG